MAAMTLLLAHLDSRGDPDSHNILTRQYLTHRAAIEQVQEHMEEVNRLNIDALSAQIANVLHRLLAIKVDTVDRRLDLARRVTTHEPEYEFMPPLNTEDDGTIVSIHIPYFGIFKIAREGGTQVGTTTDNCSTHQSQVEKSKSAAVFAGVDSGSSTTSEIMSSSDAVGGDIPAASSGTDKATASDYSVWQFYNDIFSEQSEGFPSAAMVGEDWAFQGVDMTFLDSLVGGSFANEEDSLHQEGCETLTDLEETSTGSESLMLMNVCESSCH